MKCFIERSIGIFLCIMLLMAGVPSGIAHAQTTFEGGFDEEIITVYLGDITTVSGYVKCSGSKLARITYQIDGWSGTDDNNRYCTQEASGKTVYLEDMEELVLDTTTAPLNQVGTYVLTLVAKAENDNWSKIDTAIVQVEERSITDVRRLVYLKEFPDAPITSGAISADGDVFDDDYESQYVPENNPRPSAAPTQKSAHSETYIASVSSERWGEFYESSVELTVGEIARVNGYVSSSGSEIVQVTLQIDGWYGTDDNNRYCTQSTSGYNVSLADLSSLKLDTTAAPLNAPGTYTLHLVARTADGNYNKLDSMTIYVKNGEANEPEPTLTPGTSETLPTALSSQYAVESFTSAHIRAKADKDSTSLGTVSAGTQLGYYAYSRNDNRGVTWYLVDYRGEQAWISSSTAEIVEITALPAHSDDYAPENNSEPFADPTSQPAHEPEPTQIPSASETLPTVLSSQYAVETFTSARIRAKADKNSTSLGTVSAGTQLGYYDYSKRDDRNVVWYLVNYNGTQAWISSSVAEVVGKTSKSNAETKAVSISGSFGADNYVMKVGETLDIGISASAENANLDRVTINIDNYKDNEQYATRQISGSSWNGSLTLSSSSKPLNTPGTYIIKLFVKTDAYNADGTQIFKEVDQATLTVVGISGSFRQKTYTMFVGETLDIGISASAENANLDRVTINIDNYKNNEQYATRQISGPSWNGNLTLSSSSAPLNTPGTYTIKLFVKTDAYNANGEQIYEEVDRATLVVKEKTTNKNKQSTADSNKTETTANSGERGVTAEFTYDTKTIALGDTWPLEARIRANNMQVGEVRISVLNTETVFVYDFRGDKNIQDGKYFNRYLHYDIDTNEYPFNNPGEYTLQISVKDAEGYHSYDCLDEMTIKVVAKEPYFTTDNTVENEIIRKMSANMSNYAYSFSVCNDKLIEYGFEGIVAYDYVSGAHTVACCIAKKMIWDENGQYVPLYAVIIRGTSGTDEWLSNFDIGTTGRPYGFDQAAKHTVARLRDYIAITSNGEDISKAKLWITGHSRGAAVANLIAGDYAVNELGFSSKNIYAYTFATPYTIENTERNQCNWVRNYVIDGDVVTYVPMANLGFSRFGITTTYTISSEKAKSRGMNTGATTSKIVGQFEDILKTRELYIVAYNEVKKAIKQDGELDSQSVLGYAVLADYIYNTLNEVVGLGSIVDFISFAKFVEFAKYVGRTHSIDTYLEFNNM